VIRQSGQPIEWQQVRTVFFDYDGCLHDSLVIYAPAFRKACEFLASIGLASPGQASLGLTEAREWPDADIRQWIGYSPVEMWQRFRPDLPAAIRQQASAVISQEMQRLIAAGRARLYPGTLATLAALHSKGLQLVLISHCREQYLQDHVAHFHLDRYFTRTIATETFAYASKAAILSQIAGHYPQKQVMVGDRWPDIAAGQASQMLTIGCRYGFGDDQELQDATILIDDVSELVPVFGCSLGCSPHFTMG
jgi:phosphoglycolate phosphatase